MKNLGSNESLLEQLEAALRLAYTMPPSKLKKNVIGLANLAPDLQENLLDKIDLPLQIEASNPDLRFLKTEFNRDGDSYRSPFTNLYEPKCEGYRPAGEFRKMEEMGNELFAEYSNLYYGQGAVSSFYISEGNSQNAFSCGFFAKKKCQVEGFVGAWDSFNIVDVIQSGSKFTYKLNTTVLLQLNITHQGAGNIDLTGFLKKTKNDSRVVENKTNDSEIHLATIGEMIEELETNVRQYLEGVYVARMRESIFKTRYQHTVDSEEHHKKLAFDFKEKSFKTNE